MSDDNSITWKEMYEEEKRRVDWVESQLARHLGGGALHEIMHQTHRHHIENRPPILRAISKSIFRSLLDDVMQQTLGIIEEVKEGGIYERMTIDGGRIHISIDTINPDSSEVGFWLTGDGVEEPEMLRVMYIYSFADWFGSLKIPENS